MAHPLTRGAALLRKKCVPELTQQDLASKVGVSQQAVSNWLSGYARPSRDAMAKLEDLLGIPMRAWTQEPEPENDGSEEPQAKAG